MKLLELDRSHRQAILNKEKEWQDEYDIKKSAHDQQYNNFRIAQKEIFTGIEEDLKRVLPFSDMLNISTNISLFDGLEVSVRYDIQHDNHSQSLAWNFNVRLNKDGSVKKSTGSWSGLEATTEDQLEDLEKSVMILKKLNRIDWKTVLNKSLPNYYDYVTDETPMKKSFSDEKFEADLEDAVGQDVVLINEYDYTSKADWATTYYIKKLTNKRVEYIPIYLRNLKQDDFDINSYWQYSTVVNKAKLHSILGNKYIMIDFNGNEVK